MSSTDKRSPDKVQASNSKRHPPPLIDELAEAFTVELAVRYESDEIAAKLRALARHGGELDPTVRKRLIAVLQIGALRATDFADQLAEFDDGAASTTAPAVPLSISSGFNSRGKRGQSVWTHRPRQRSSRRKHNNHRGVPHQQINQSNISRPNMEAKHE
jgi:hypothetical protein